MIWLVIVIAAFMAIANLATSRKRPDRLLRGLAWASFLGYLLSLHTVLLLYLAIAIFVVGLFWRGKAVRTEETATSRGDADATNDPAPVPAPLPCAATPQELTVPLTLESPETFPTADDRMLTLDTGRHQLLVSFRVLYRHPETGVREFPIDTFAITHRVADDQGQVWQADVPVSSELLTTACSERLEALQAGKPVVLHCEEHAPASWRELIAQRALLCGVRDLDDSGMAYDVSVDDRPFVVRATEQTPAYDLAWSPDASTFVVRVTGLKASIASDATPLLPPCYFTLAPEQLLLQITEHYHDGDGTAHGEADDSPFVITFHPTPHTAPANPGVTVAAV